MLRIALLAVSLDRVATLHRRFCAARMHGVVVTIHGLLMCGRVGLFCLRC